MESKLISAIVLAGQRINEKSKKITLGLLQKLINDMQSNMS